MKHYLITEKNPITLKDLPNVSAQEVFNQAANYMLANTTLLNRVRGNGRYVTNLVVKSKDKVETVRIMCVAGCFISQQEYDPEFEDWNWERLVNNKEVPVEHAELIYDLQCVFDDALQEKDMLYSIWEKRLNRIAKKYDLKFCVE